MQATGAAGMAGNPLGIHLHKVLDHNLMGLHAVTASNTRVKVLPCIWQLTLEGTTEQRLPGHSVWSIIAQLEPDCNSLPAAPTVSRTEKTTQQ